MVSFIVHSPIVEESQGCVAVAGVATVGTLRREVVGYNFVTCIIIYLGGSRGGIHNNMGGKSGRLAPLVGTPWDPTRPPFQLYTPSAFLGIILSPRCTL